MERDRDLFECDVYLSMEINLPVLGNTKIKSPSLSKISSESNIFQLWFGCEKMMSELVGSKYVVYPAYLEKG